MPLAEYLSFVYVIVRRLGAAAENDSLVVGYVMHQRQEEGSQGSQSDAASHKQYLLALVEVQRVGFAVRASHADDIAGFKVVYFRRYPAGLHYGEFQLFLIVGR